MIDVEVFGLPTPRDARSDVPDAAGVRELCLAAAARAGVRDGHLAVQFVDAPTIAALNAEHRCESHPTDVLSFPIDGAPAVDDAPGDGTDGGERGVGAPADDGVGAPADDGLRATADEGVGVTANGGAARARVHARAGELDGRLGNAVDDGRLGNSVERELGDVVICIEHTTDVAEAIVHGVLHLAGMDHETDDGEMLALQREVLAELRAHSGDRSAAHEAR